MAGPSIPEGGELPAHLGEHRARLRSEVLRGRLGIDLDVLDEEEAAVLRHLLQRLGALALRDDHALEQR